MAQRQANVRRSPAGNKGAGLEQRRHSVGWFTHYTAYTHVATFKDNEVLLLPVMQCTSCYGLTTIVHVPLHFPAGGPWLSLAHNSTAATGLPMPASPCKERLSQFSRCLLWICREGRKFCWEVEVYKPTVGAHFQIPECRTGPSLWPTETTASKAN